MAAIFTIQIRLTKNQKERLKILTDGAGFKTISSYVRFMLFNPTFDMKLNKILEILEELKQIK
jgi:predicted DNA-binding protein